MPNEQPEAKKLAALDRAATQGQWVPNEVGGGAFSTWDHMPVLAGKTMDVELCCKLVNAYRANRLVLIGPDAVEVVARVIASTSAGAWEYLHVSTDPKDWEFEARAALDALGVK